MPFGIPLPLVKPENISEEEWEAMHTVWSSYDEVREKVGDHSPLLFVGGALEACIGKFIQYVGKYYHYPKRELSYIPELCVIVDENLWRTTMKPRLDEMGVGAMDYQSALSLVQGNKH